MNKLTALIEAAKDVLDTDNICPYANAAEYNRLANPATILELCALLEKAEEDLVFARQVLSDHRIAYISEALAAIKQWKEQT